MQVPTTVDGLSPWRQLAAIMRPQARLFDSGITSLSAWCEDHNITVENRALDFKGRPWMRALYDDDARHVVLIKATQVGGSVCAIVRCLYLSQKIPDWRGWIYYFPTKGDVIDFSQTRVGPLISENPDFLNAIGDIDKAGVRQFGHGFFYFRGMRSNIALKSAPADGLVFDELDEATEAARQMALERMGASTHKFIYELSNPSIPQFGIDLAYSGNPDAGIEGSDQRIWMIKCGHCSKWSNMEDEFPQQIGATDLRCLRPRKGVDERAPNSWYRACVHCSREIYPVNGEWVARFPDPYRSHGYRLSQLFSPTIDPVEIVQTYRRQRYPHHFYNLKVGIAWVDAADHVAAHEVLAWRSQHIPMLGSSHLPCTMGVDQGADLHVFITRPTDLSAARQLVHVGKYKARMPEDWNVLDDLMRRFKVQRCVVDGLPNQSLARAFALRHPRKVFLNYYADECKGRTKWNEDDLTVREDRTEAIDALLMCFRAAGAHRIALPNHPEVEVFARHCAAITKRRIEDDDKSVVYRYERTGPDHYLHAAVYDGLCWLADIAPADGVPTRKVVFGSIGREGVSVEAPPPLRKKSRFILPR